MSIIPISVKKLVKNPKFSGVYKDYDKLKVVDCNDLITYLYSGRKTGWENPLTFISLKRESKIIVSFLSYCYYILDDGSKVNIVGHNLSYREHVLQFIDEIYLYEKGRVSVSAATQLAQTNTPLRSSRSPSPTRGTSQAARGATAQPAARGATAQPAARAPAAPSPVVLSPNAPSPFARARSPSPARGPFPVLAAKSSSSSAKLSYSPATLYKAAQSIVSLNDTSNRLTKEEALSFVKELRALKKGKTIDQMKRLTIRNPITSVQIGLKGLAFQRLIYKLYNYDDEELKKAIRKVVSKKFLDDLQTHINSIKVARQSAADKVRYAKADAQAAALAALAKEKEDMAKNKPTCEGYIDGCMKDFHKCCDDLEAACDKDGVLAEYIHITKVVNAIVVVILTKYLHLPYYHDDLYKNKMYDAPLPITLFMFDGTINDYYEAKGKTTVVEMINYAYNKGSVIYQNTELKQDVSKKLIDNILISSEAHYLNTLLNRQFIFDIKKRDWDDGGRRAGDLHFVTPSVVYNHYNELDIYKYPSTPYTSLQFPHTLGYAMKQFSKIPFNYNITNSLLPRTIFVTATDQILQIHKPFSELMMEINERLMNMPRITGIAKEATHSLAFYEDKLKNMEQHSFGSNDVIRRNIMYSLNAQTPSYVRKNPDYYKGIFYNYGYTGMFPLFTWIPSTLDKKENLYTLSSCFLWQPYGATSNMKFRTLGDAYKNYGFAPWSKMLNEAIYKVITKTHSSVLDIPYLQNDKTERDRMIQRVKGTIGVYKDMEIDPQYANKPLYFYHGTANRLHTMKDRDNDIEILGFLSTSLNVYTASYYSEIGLRGSGYIYIIESDDKKGFINLNDQLYQFILLPNSIIRIVYEFNIGDLTIILCRLIMTPSKEVNTSLYNNLLGIPDASGSGAAGAAGAKGGKASAKATRAAMVVRIAKTFQNVKAVAMATAMATAASAASQGTIIKPKADMRKIGDMPADIREYYGLTFTEHNKNEKVDINNGCYVRLISRKVVDRMLANGA